MDDHEELPKLFKVLMHPVRLAILELLRDGEQCVCHLEAFMGQRQAYISQQLMILREAGLVQDRREGWNIFYRAVEPRIFAVIDAASQITGTNTQQTHLEYDRITSQATCDCPKCNQQSYIFERQAASDLMENE